MESNKVSKMTYFNFNKFDDIKKIETRFLLNLKSYDKNMVLDIFANGLDETENKYLSQTQTTNEKNQIKKLFGLYLLFPFLVWFLNIFKNGIYEPLNKYLYKIKSPTLTPTLTPTPTPTPILNEKSKINNLFGLYLMSMGKFDKAIEYFKKSFELGNNKSLNNIAICYREIQEFDLAKEYYFKSIKLLEPNSYSGLGNLYLDYELENQAIKYWTKGLENNCKKCLLFLAEYYKYIDDYEKAKEYYEKGIIMIENDLDNLDNLDNSSNYLNDIEFRYIIGIYGKFGKLLWDKFYNYENSLKYLQKGMELNDSYSYLYYAQILQETKGNINGINSIINDWETVIIDCLEKSIKIDMNIESIKQLSIIYKKKNKIEKMLELLILGSELNNYDCIRLLANYYETNNDYVDNLQKSIELYYYLHDNFVCDYSLVKLATIYGSKELNNIEKFIFYNGLAKNLQNWISCYHLGLYYLLQYSINNSNDNLEKSIKYLIKALDLYWTYDEEVLNIIFKEDSDIILEDEYEYEYTHDYDNNDDDILVDYFIDKYKKIFELKNLIEKIKYYTNDKTNIIDFIKEIKKLLFFESNKYYPILIIILLNNLINEQKILLDELIKINKSLTSQSNFIFGMIKILEFKINQKTIINRIKRAKKNKNFKVCIVCYETKAHIKFNCGHEICCCCYKKMHKCYYNCN